MAPNLDTATRVAYGPKRRWRVVTVDGQLIDTSGTMSGGGTKVVKKPSERTKCVQKSHSHKEDK